MNKPGHNPRYDSGVDRLVANLGPTIDCPACFGKGSWVGISDAAWHREGTRAKPDKIYRCSHCRSTGKVKDRPPQGSAE